MNTAAGDQESSGVGEQLAGPLLFALSQSRFGGHRERAIAVAALCFAILGAIAGLTSTIRGGDAMNVAYHTTILPLLLIMLGAALGKLPVRPRPPAAATAHD